jgi:hypothetical protein
VSALPETPALSGLLAYANRLGTQVVRHNDDESFEFGGMEVNVFAPPADRQTSSQPRNNDFLVLRFR